MPVIVGVALGGALGAAVRGRRIGGYTTFSTYLQETYDLGDAVALAYVVASILTGLVVLYVGLRVGRLL